MTDLLKTALTELHQELGAKLVPFAGYEMPVQYPMGVLGEHNHTRTEAGLFDVSHMGQVILRPKNGTLRDAALALETLIPQDVADLEEDRQRYGFFTNDTGGILDDLMFANRGDHLFLVVNAACKEQDIAHMQAHLSDVCELTVITDRALIALQGPKAEAALETLIPGVAAMKFMDVLTASYKGAEFWISRSGYTGEDGYEISLPNSVAEDFTRALLNHEDVAPIGLGARDSLRLEGGLCLYGNDIDETTSPIEAALIWAIQKVRRTDGARAGGFPGAEQILDHITNGAERKRVGLRPDGRAPMRAGTVIFADETTTTPLGTVTSGGFGPTVGGPISMAYLTKSSAAKDTTVFAEVRGKRMPAIVCALPFTPANFKR